MIALLVSFNTLSYTSEGIFHVENQLKSHVDSQITKARCLQINPGSNDLSLHRHTKNSSSSNEGQTPLLQYQNCDCCEFFCSVSCTGCTAVIGVALCAYWDNNIEYDITNKIAQSDSSYTSLLASPPEHRPKLTFFLAT